MVSGISVRSQRDGALCPFPCQVLGKGADVLASMTLGAGKVRGEPLSYCGNSDSVRGGRSYGGWRTLDVLPWRFPL